MADISNDRLKDKLIVGLIEKVKIYDGDGKRFKEVVARIDTGATKSSVDVNLAAQLKIGPILETKVVKSASGRSIRPVVMVTVEVAGKKIVKEFTVADRRVMKYSLLIGQNILKDNFLVDCSVDKVDQG